ncbi:MAG: hypothetical protein JWP88_642 [Flaviaesturariibacter sp.]|nr:hypothetical protein [Flaviaesturariibacter sp.]
MGWQLILTVVRECVSEYKGACSSGNDSVTPKFIHRLYTRLCTAKPALSTFTYDPLTKLNFFPHTKSGCEQVVWESIGKELFGGLAKKTEAKHRCIQLKVCGHFSFKTR